MADRARRKRTIGELDLNLLVARLDRLRLRAATARTLVDLVLVDRSLVAGGRAVRPQVGRDRLPAGLRVVASM